MNSILEVFQQTSGQWGGRILRGGIEDGRVAGCATPTEVESQAVEAGIVFSEVRQLHYVPGVDEVEQCSTCDGLGLKFVHNKPGPVCGTCAGSGFVPVDNLPF